jgi:hypothetical protein
VDLAAVTADQTMRFSSTAVMAMMVEAVVEAMAWSEAQ